MDWQSTDPAIIHMNRVWRQTVSEQAAVYAKPQAVYVEKWARFVLVDGKWDVQMWPTQETGTDKLFKVRIPVPAELIGADIQAMVEQQMTAT